MSTARAGRPGRREQAGVVGRRRERDRGPREAVGGVTSAAARTLRVEVEPAYDVHVGADALSAAGSLVAEANIAVITDSTVGRLYGAQLSGALREAGKRATTVTFTPGEASKDLATYGRVVRDLAARGLGRDAAIVALGGGVAGDLAGFVAATYLRGIAYYQVPTTLLAMVDSSVGGKTGVDLPEGKNLVGAFWQPKAVLADVTTLRSLPARELRQGTAELLKTGLIGDPSLTDVASLRLVPAVTGKGPLPPEDELVDAVSRSVAVKAAVVSADEREQGVRAHLNLGHTLGHAIEAASRFAVPHGDAVLYGIVFAALLGRERGYADLVEPLALTVKRLSPEPLPRLAMVDLLPYLARDKKVIAGRSRFVLLADVGEPVIVDDVSENEMRSAWSELEEMMR